MPSSPGTHDTSAASQAATNNADAELFQNLDPALHTLNSVAPGGNDENQLNNLQNLATQAIEMHDNAPLHDQEALDLNSSLGFHDDSSLFTATGEARFSMFDDKERQGEQQAEFNFETEQPQTLNETAQAVAVVSEEHDGSKSADGEGRLGGRNKRRRGDADYVVGPVENGDPIDPIKMKKDSHVSIRVWCV